MKVHCKNCKWHNINFWGYDECWKFNLISDDSRTVNTAHRERTAKRLNKYNACIYYKCNRWWRVFIKNKIQESKENE